jgi:hypothetical protein
MKTAQLSSDMKIYNTFGKHSKPPPVTLSNAKDRTLSGTIAANLQAIIAPVSTVT